MKRLSLYAGLMLVVAAGSFGETEHGPVTGEWKFAVAGDSRNCGDVVMPSVAEKVRENGAAFYWHLGDYRATYDFDQDYKARNRKLPSSNTKTVLGRILFSIS